MSPDLDLPRPAPYPRPGDPPLEVISTLTTEIRVRVPDMEEITLDHGQHPVRLEIHVAGVEDEAPFEFAAFRP